MEAVIKLLQCPLRFIPSPCDSGTAGWMCRAVMGARKALLGSALVPTLTRFIPVIEKTGGQDSAEMENDQKWERGR